MIYKSFIEFLRDRQGSPEVGDILIKGIETADFPENLDSNNLYAITPHFLKSCGSDPQKVLEALLVAYNRWVLSTMSAMGECLERCATANRVIFIEDAAVTSEHAAIWKGVNECMSGLSGMAEDLAVQSNYLINQRVAAREG